MQTKVDDDIPDIALVYQIMINVNEGNLWHAECSLPLQALIFTDRSYTSGI